MFFSENGASSDDDELVKAPAARRGRKKDSGWAQKPSSKQLQKAMGKLEEDIPFLNEYAARWLKRSVG